MLILLCLLTGCALSAGVCFLTGAFEGLQWLYLLPACFVGGFLLGAILVAVFLCVVCAVVDMKVLGEMSFREISETLHIPMGTVTWRYQNAIKKLRRCGYE